MSQKTGPDSYFVHPRDVSAFGFDWGRLSLTVGPEVNGATQFSGGVVDLPAGQGHSRHNHPGAEPGKFLATAESTSVKHASRPALVLPGALPKRSSSGPVTA